MPFALIDHSPSLPGVSPVKIHYRETGQGTPLIFLHGGWGYKAYPFDRQIPDFKGRFRILIPDRSGYGRSQRIESVEVDFHRRASVEMLNFIDALRLERPVLWGHSDGAVIAALMGLAAPERISGVIFEAFHYYRVKPGSKEFFTTTAREPEKLGERVCNALARDHGADYWKRLILMNGKAWNRLALESSHPKEDLYGGGLSALAVSSLFIHGSRDPRTEPDELGAVRRELPGAALEMIEGAGHSPHSEGAASKECSRVAGEFLLPFSRR